MFFLALAADYDGTLADRDTVEATTWLALRRLRAAGRRLILVTGRELPELLRLIPDPTVFDRIVAENGALLFDPASGSERLLAPPPPKELASRLRERGVSSLSEGRVILATWEPHRSAVLDTIHELGLEMQIIFNKGALMILPPGVNKGSGLVAALEEMELSRHNVVCVGDAENDHALLQIGGCRATVANAMPALAAIADVRLNKAAGAGVEELVERLLAEDHALVPPERHGIPVGSDQAGKPVLIEPFGGLVLVTGPSGCGKSTFATALTEQFAARRYEFCVFDPEGDYIDLEHTVFIGTLRSPPPAAETLKLLRDDSVNLVVNTQSLPIDVRRRLCWTMLRRTAAMRAETGRPHWIAVDEAHQIFPRDASRESSVSMSTGTVLLTAYPDSLCTELLRSVETLIVLGSAARSVAASLAGRMDWPGLRHEGGLEASEGLVWCRQGAAGAIPVNLIKPLQVHRRHRGKYADGDVGAVRSFYFRGPTKALNLPARNLYDFIDLATALDDEVWEHHLRAGDYSAWFRHVIKDPDLSLEAARVEADTSLTPRESRRRIRKAIWRRYAAPSARSDVS
ncbi:HAD-IIB family hydrolase [Mangrovicella endophytica]|uniref:HAD-IIB family hydrolase n=1 Tax=Mangrovicella endophytica TaxID=2066697 RepID=UPI000C9E3AF7|nr:HAD-IIB family hydrolase [Mangrovicella endophytica]